VGHTVAVVTCGALRKRRKTGRAEVKEENYDNEQDEWQGRGKGEEGLNDYKKDDKN
jgi:hypothetical protein